MTPPDNSGPPPGYTGSPGGYQGPPGGYKGPPGGYQGPPDGYQGYPGGYPGPPPQSTSKTPLIAGAGIVLLVLLGIIVFLLTRGDDGGDYAEFAPAAPAPVAATDAPVASTPEPIAAAGAAAAPTSAAAPTAAAPSAAPRPSPSSGSYTIPPNANSSYDGNLDLSGTRIMCTTYDRTSVPGFRGMELCYEIQMQQHRDGSLQGSGVKTMETLPGRGRRDLPPSEQTSIRLTGYIDATNSILLEYSEQGQQRTTKGVAEFDGERAEHHYYPGVFRTDAAGASGSSTFTTM